MVYHSIFISLGSNLGNRLELLKTASYLIDIEVGKIIKASSVYETSAWGMTDQPDFLNQVIQIESGFAADTILQKILAIELSMGRERIVKWGQRTIDIDLLFFDDLITKSNTLTLPHPFIQERRFIVEPLAEIAPEFIHPVLNKTVLQLLKDCPDVLEVRKIKDS